MPRIIFISADGSEQAEFNVPPGLTVLEIAHKYGLDIEGACGGAMACSTCHVLVDRRYFDKIPKPLEEEDDMLDLTFGVAKTSRLGCQIVVTDALDGLTLRLPPETKNRQER